MREKPFTDRPPPGYKPGFAEGTGMPDIKVNRSHGLAMSTLGDAVVVVWKDHCVQEGWAWLAREVDRTIARQGSAFVLSIILPTSSPPPAPVRESVKNDMKRWGTGLRHFVFVPLGDSLWLHIVRSTARGVLMLSGMTGRYTVTDTIEDGISTTVNFASDESPSPRTISAVLGNLFHELGAPPR